MSTWRPVSKLPRWLSWLPWWMHTPLRCAFYLAIALIALGLAVALFYFIKASRFDLEQVAKLPDRTVLLDHNQHPVDISWGSNRHLAQREDLSDFLVQSLLAREDARFFSHPGVDFMGLGRATLRNLKDLDFTQGASTLTMQLTRNTFDLSAESIHRKLLEIAVSLRVEGRYSKDEILTHYLNRIYFGAGCHGIEEASRIYFGKSVSGLNEAESAMLIGIIRGPHLFSPIRNLKGARDQQSEVLSRLVDEGQIDDADKERILNIPIRLVPAEQRSSERSYAFQAVREELDSILEAGDIRQDDLIVHTTLNLDWQLRLEAAVSSALSQIEQNKSWPHPCHRKHTPGDTPEYLQFAAVTLDSKSGGVLAWIGGRDFLDSRYDRVTGARRDLGSAFEPWIAAAASERGKRVLAGQPLLTGRQLGPQETTRIAKRCGLGGPFLKTEDLFRGSAASSPKETSIGLASLAASGKRPQAHFITHITDAEGKLLFERKLETSPAITPHAAKQACNLFEVVGGSRCFQGTTGSGRNAWLLRIGPSGSTAIWIGFDEPTRIAEGDELKKILALISKQLGG